MRNALDGDPVSAFGGIVGLNRPLDAATAEVLAEPDRFIEAIVAPEFEPAGLEILTTKPKWKANVRLLQVGSLADAADAWQFRPIEGGFLMQEADVAGRSRVEWQVVTNDKPTDATAGRIEIRLGDRAAREIERDRAHEGSDAGGRRGRADEPRRFDADRHSKGRRPREGLACWRPTRFFRSAIRLSWRPPRALRAVIQPGGSKRDDEVIAACNQHGIPMIVTGRRHFQTLTSSAKFMSVLDEIVATKRREIEAAKSARPEAKVRAAAEAAPPPRNFFDALAAPGPIKLIAEVKKASPSAGVIRADFDPVEIARIYEQHGATCLSVLTDEPIFPRQAGISARHSRDVSIAGAAKGFHSRQVSALRSPRGRGRCRAVDRRMPGRLQSAGLAQRGCRDWA